MLDMSALFSGYAHWRVSILSSQDPSDAQRATLSRLVHRARDTKFGHQHDFGKINSVEDYQHAVPLRRYEEFWQEYWRDAFPVIDGVTWPGRIPYFAYSSGTSGGPTKNIPVSMEMLRANRRAAIDLLVHHFSNRPDSRPFAGTNFMLGGNTALVTLAPGVYGGDLSGIAAARVPWWAKPFYFPRGEAAQTADWEEKTRLLAALSLKENIRSIAGTPSWLLLFFEELRRIRNEKSGRLVDFYPDLELVCHGGVSFAPYRERFTALISGSRAELREVYSASEGFVAVADRRPEDGLRLIADNGLFAEFVPIEEIGSRSPTRHWAFNVETGQNYALVLTTCAGIWSYILGDTVRVLTRSPLRLAVTGRISYSLSAFGEHLIGEEIENAASAAASTIGASITDFLVGAVYPEISGVRGHHRYLVEFADRVNSMQVAMFAEVLDNQLCAANLDYADHRRGDFGIGRPEVIPLSPGSFAAWMKERGKLGGQNKVPRVISDPLAFRNIQVELKNAPAF